MSDINRATRRALRFGKVQEKVPYSRATIYRLMREGKFPANFKLAGPGGHAAAWDSDEIDAWLEKRMSFREATQ